MLAWKHSRIACRHSSTSSRHWLLASRHNPLACRHKPLASRHNIMAFRHRFLIPRHRPTGRFAFKGITRVGEASLPSCGSPGRFALPSPRMLRPLIAQWYLGRRHERLGKPDKERRRRGEPSPPRLQRTMMPPKRMERVEPKRPACFGVMHKKPAPAVKRERV